VRLRSSDAIAGVPVLRVRSGLRRLDQFSTTAAGASRLFRVVPAEGLRLVRELVTRGVLERDPDMRGMYRLTVRGHAFAHASAAQPLRRATVDRRLVELVERMIQVNASDGFIVGIERAYVFGSYLTDTDRLGDLDVSVTLYAKEPNRSRFVALCREQAWESGRRFANYAAELAWPETKVLLFLKHRSRVYSLHQDERLLRDRRVRRRAIFLRRRPTRFVAGVIRRLAAEETPAERGQ
jgi:hypothetical protein